MLPEPASPRQDRQHRRKPSSQSDCRSACRPSKNGCSAVVKGFGALALHDSYNEKPYDTWSAYTAQQPPSSARTVRCVKQPHTEFCVSPATKRTLKDRFWSRSGANYFGPDPVDLAQPDMTIQRTPYVPTHAASDFCRTTTAGGVTVRSREEQCRQRAVVLHGASGASSMRSGTTTTVATPAEPTTDYTSFVAKAEADARRSSSQAGTPPVSPSDKAEQAPRLRSPKSIARLGQRVAEYIKPA